MPRRSKCYQTKKSNGLEILINKIKPKIIFLNKNHILMQETHKWSLLKIIKFCCITMYIPECGKIFKIHYTSRVEYCDETVTWVEWSNTLNNFSRSVLKNRTQEYSSSVGLIQRKNTIESVKVSAI